MASERQDDRLPWETVGGPEAGGRVPITSEPRADYSSQVLPGLVTIGLGVGLTFVSITTAALAGVDDAAAGLASGL
jgi:hypothetical protein